MAPSLKLAKKAINVKNKTASMPAAPVKKLKTKAKKEVVVQQPEEEEDVSEDDNVPVYFDQEDDNSSSEDEDNSDAEVEVDLVAVNVEGEEDSDAQADRQLLQAVGEESSSEDEGADSSADEEDVEGSASHFDAFKANLPKVLLDSASQKKRKTPEETPGVVFLGRIPHGFYEKEMASYFSQFGRVLRLRLSRNRKTGQSKHFAFIEFDSEKVAKVVAETMDNYLLMNHLLKCKFVEAEKLHPRTFVGCDRTFKAIPWNKVERIRHNRAKSPESLAKNISRLVKKEKAKRKKLAALGIRYDFAGYAGSAAPADTPAPVNESKEQKTTAPITTTTTTTTTPKKKSSSKKAKLTTTKA